MDGTIALARTANRRALNRTGVAQKPCCRLKPEPDYGGTAEYLLELLTVDE
jgi:hypothetical protein